MSYKTTKQDFDLFVAESKRWIEYLGLKSWEINFGWDTDGNRASCASDIDNRIAIILVGKEVWETKPDKREIKLCAFHEVWELLLSEYRYAAESRFTTATVLESLRHKIIATMENTMFVDVNPLKGKEK